MTFERIYHDLSVGIMKPEDVYQEIQEKDKMKRINYYAHLIDIRTDPLTESQLGELDAICNILQAIYTSDAGSPIADTTYDILQEMLIDMGIPRLTGSIEINDNKKIGHTFKTLRGTLDKIYYLTTDEPRTNKSRKYLDEWKKSTEALYEKKSGNKINLDDVRIVVTPKFDGTSVVLEWDGKNALWLSRGLTASNLASDESIHMKRFNSIFATGEPKGVKFELMISEESKDKINELYVNKPYHNSRQIVTSIMNSNEPDFKEEYLVPVPLRLIHPGEDVEEIHPLIYEKFPTLTCKLGDREKIREFANNNQYVRTNGNDKLRTDGAVITILDKNIQRILGRDNNINNFEVAYKFTEEFAYTKVKNVEFYVSEFGYITPVLVTNDVILKGNTINHISLSNKERFDELNLCYGDTIKILYDIIPYATLDNKCPKQPNGRKIEFVKRCPRCHEHLDLNAVQVQCKNMSCPSRIVGNIMNYCNKVRIQNIGFNTLDTLYSAGLLPNGIRSLYQLKKKKLEIQDLEGFGKLKAGKIIGEIEAKRRLKDFEFFGAIGIEGLSTKTFKQIFQHISVEDLINMINDKNFDLLEAKLTSINGIGYYKAKTFREQYKDVKSRKALRKLLNEISITSTYGIAKDYKGRVVFTGCRSNNDLDKFLESKGYESSDSWSNDASYLIIPREGFTSSKTTKANDRNIPIITLDKIREVIK
jgi:NAD-dependent DNA ligase